MILGPIKTTEKTVSYRITLDSDPQNPVIVAAPPGTPVAELTARALVSKARQRPGAISQSLGALTAAGSGMVETGLEKLGMNFDNPGGITQGLTSLGNWFLPQSGAELALSMIAPGTLAGSKSIVGALQGMGKLGATGVAVGGAEPALSPGTSRSDVGAGAVQGGLTGLLTGLISPLTAKGWEAGRNLLGDPQDATRVAEGLEALRGKGLIPERLPKFKGAEEILRASATEGGAASTWRQAIQQNYDQDMSVVQNIMKIKMMVKEIIERQPGKYLDEAQNLMPIPLGRLPAMSRAVKALRKSGLTELPDPDASQAGITLGQANEVLKEVAAGAFKRNTGEVKGGIAPSQWADLYTRGRADLSNYLAVHFPNDLGEAGPTVAARYTEATEKYARHLAISDPFEDVGAKNLTKPGGRLDMDRLRGEIIDNLNRFEIRHVSKEEIDPLIQAVTRGSRNLSDRDAPGKTWDILGTRIPIVPPHLAGRPFWPSGTFSAGLPSPLASGQETLMDYLRGR